MSVHRFAGHRFLPHLAGALAILVILLAGATSLHAQLSTQATITGTVTDPTGAVVSGATVTLTDDATKVSTVTKTNRDGVYNVPDLVVDTYTVAITKNGFKTETVSGVELHPTETVTVNARLAVGAETQNITVAAVSTEVETSTAEVSADVSSEEVSTLPMNGRNYQALAVMMPGVTSSSQGTSLGTGGRSTSSVLSINGLDVSRSFYVLDGVWNENTGNMTANSVVPNPDSLEEVRVLQNNFSAQYSLLGSSVIIAQTKSGTANWHGTAWEFWRNTDLNAINYYSTAAAPYHQNIFGYNASGPVYIPHHYNADKKKTFFFWDEQWVILHVPNQVTSVVPTSLEAAGCFFSPVKDPASGNLFPTSTGGSCPAGYYQIPSSRINTSSAAYVATLYPAPNYVLPGSTTNYINNKAQITDQRDDEIKIDHNFNAKYHAMGEYLDEYQSYAQNTESPGTTPISTETDFTHNKLAQVSLTQTLTPNMINTTSVAMNIYLLNLTLVGTMTSTSCRVSLKLSTIPTASTPTALQSSRSLAAWRARASRQPAPSPMRPILTIRSPTTGAGSKARTTSRRASPSSGTQSARCQASRPMEVSRSAAASVSTHLGTKDGSGRLRQFNDRRSQRGICFRPMQH